MRPSRTGRLAVVIVHGVEVADARFAATTIARLTRLFARECGMAEHRAREILVFRSVHWAPVFEERESELLSRLFVASGRRFAFLHTLAERLNAGSAWWLVPFLAEAGRQSRESLKYPALRWLITHFIGDIIAYQRTPEQQADYDRVHALYATALRELRRDAGEAAPLCVIAHSFGTVITSDFFYDLQKGPPPVRPSPLERGETLCQFFTMGSPMALWALRYTAAALDRPLVVPHPRLAEHHGGLAGHGGWINFYDDDDILATPLRGLSDAYRRAVKADVAVSLRGPLFSWQPAVHPFYWSDDSVLVPVARELARTWRAVDGGRATVMAVGDG
jgi:hypothetical protein